VDLQRCVEVAHTWTAHFGAAAPVAYGAFYVVSTLLGAPGIPFAIVAGLLFGSLGAVSVMTVASSVSAMVGFLIARHVARDAVAYRFGATESFQRLSGLVERQAWVVVIIRAVPVLPFALVNYSLGLTAMSFWRYLLWSEIAIVAGDAAIVLGARALYDAAVSSSAPGGLLSAMMAGGFLVVGLFGFRKRAGAVGLLDR